MLGNEYRMPFHRGLFAVIFRKWWRQKGGMKSKAWERMVSIPLSWMYWRFLSVNLNLDLNFDFFSVARALAIWSIISEQHSHHPTCFTTQ